jgi:hypothetical protein
MTLQVWDFVFLLAVILIGTVGGRWLVNMFIPSAGERRHIEALFKESERALAGAREHAIDTEKFRARLEMLRAQMGRFDGAGAVFDELLFARDLGDIDLDTFHRARVSLGNAFVNIQTRLEDGPKVLKFGARFDALSRQLGEQIRRKQKEGRADVNIPVESLGLVPVLTMVQGMKQLAVHLAERRICELSKPPDERVLDHYLRTMPGDGAVTNN